jgi:hypothetical protein
VLLELAWSLGASFDALLVLGGGCALAGAGATALAVRRATPSAPLAAAVLDELLGRGATLATAAEALEGAHPRFAPALLAEADAALVAVDLRRLLPLRASAGLLLAAAVAVLWGALLPSARAEPAAPAPQTRTPLVALLGGGAGPAEGEPAPTPAGLDPGDVVAVRAAPGDDPAADPAAALAARAPEAAALLQEQLEALLTRVAAVGGAPGQADPALPAATPALDEALRSGDLAAARAELERLAEAAGRGDRAAEARLGELTRTLGQALDPGAAGSGSGSGAEDPPAPSAGPAPPTTTPPTGDAGRGRRPWALDATTRRYFDADPLRSRPPRSTRDTQGTGR